MNDTPHPRCLALAIRTAAAIAYVTARLAVPGVSGADEPKVPEIVAPFVSETTILVLKLDPKRIGLSNSEDHLASLPTEAQDALRNLVARTDQTLEWLRATIGEECVYATVGIPLSKSHYPAFVIMRATPAFNPDALLKRLDAKPSQSCVRNDHLIIGPMSGTDVTRQLDMSPPSPRPELVAACSAIADYPVQLLLLPPAHVRATIRDLMPTLPRQLGGGPSEILTDGLGWAALGIDPARLRIALIVQSNSDRGASALADYLPSLLNSIWSALPNAQQRRSPESIKALVSQLKPQVVGDRITVRLEGWEQSGASLGLLTEFAGGLEGALVQRANTGRFKQILLAMHNYHDTHRSLPPRQEFRDANGRSKLSWRVHILPFVEQTALYEKFHLDEAWDSPHNKALVESIPDLYKSRAFDVAPGGDLKPGYTTFLAPVGERTVFGGPKATRFNMVSDGTSNTIVLVEVRPELAVPWTAPDDYAFDPQAPGKGLRIGENGRFLAALCDGSVQPLRGDLKPEMILRLFQMNDGAPVDW